MSERAIFIAALEIDDPSERAAFLDQACADDRPLRQRIERLLKAHEPADSFLEHRPPGLGETIDKSPITEHLGTIIGPYELKEQIGEGGFGLVFVAEQQEPVRRKVALKIIKPGMDSREVIARFEAERQALALMDHPNIAHIFDGGTTESGRPYFVMELVKGIPITEYCDQQQLTAKDRLQLFLTVCQAVQHAHGKGVIHRDLKPSNILVAPHDGVPVVKVIDFGVAKAIGQQLTDKKIYTRFTQMIGTPQYMSPEQAEINALDVDIRSDVYSLGVLLYELLTGTTPFIRERFATAAYDEIRRIIREEEPPRPSTRLSTLGATLSKVSEQRKTVPGKLSALVKGDLDWIVMKALEKDRLRRYETASGMAKDVERFLKDETVEACPPSAWHRLRKVARRNKAAAVTVGLVAASLVLGILGTAVGLMRAVDAEAKAVANEVKAKEEESKAKAARYAEEQRSQELDNALKETEQAERSEKKNSAELAIALETAKQAQLQAKTNEIMADWRLYASNIASAQREWETNNVELFNHYLNQSRLEFRGWEHAYLYTLANQGQQTLPGPFGNVEDVAFSPDGKLLAIASEDKAVELWDVSGDRGKLIIKLQTGQNILSVALAFSPDGKSLATATHPLNYAPQLAGSYGDVKLWDTASGKPLQTFKGNQGPVCSLAFSPDGKLLAGAGFGGGSKQLCDMIKLWNIDRGKEVLTVTGDPNGASPRQRIGVAFSPDGRRFASASFDGSVKLWELASGQVSLTLQAPKAGAKVFGGYVAFSADGKHLISSSFDKTVKLWDIASGQALQTINVPIGKSQRMAISADGKRLASPCDGDDKAIRLYDITNGQELPSLKGHQVWVQCAAFSSDGKRLASAGSVLRGNFMGEVKLWDTSSLQPGGPRTLHGHSLPVQSVAFSPDGKRLASGAGSILSFPNVGQPHGDKSNLILWDTASGQKVLTFKMEGAEGQVSTVVFSPDGKLLASGSELSIDRVKYEGLKAWNAIRLWDTTTGQEIRTFKWPTDGVSSLAFSPDGKCLASAGMARYIGELKLWDLATGREVVTFQGHKNKGRCVVFGPDSKLLASGGADGVKLWDATTGAEKLSIKISAGNVGSLAFSPDGTKLLGSSGGDLRLWDATSGKALLLVKVSPSTVGSVAFSSDGRRMVGACDSELKLWDADSGQEVLTLKAHSDKIRSIALSPDGKQIATASAGTIIIWDASKSMPEAPKK